jgi:hypothetical protein
MWLCLFVDFSFVRCVVVLDVFVFVGATAFCLAMIVVIHGRLFREVVGVGT